MQALEKLPKQLRAFRGPNALFRLSIHVLYNT